LADIDVEHGSFARASLRAGASLLGLWLWRQGRAALGAFVAFTLLTGCIFPMVLLGLGRAIFPEQAAGSLVVEQGRVVGSRLIGQTFARPEYFHPRPSAAGAGYDPLASGGSNLAPSNPKLTQALDGRALAYRRENGLSPDATVPVEAVTASGSGLDPHITSADAALQIPRVARARSLSPAAVRALVEAHTAGRDLGILGEPRVEVLELNLALDRAGRGLKG
jgi:K+-transporting ATPase ATPase C chain